MASCSLLVTVFSCVILLLFHSSFLVRSATAKPAGQKGLPVSIEDTADLLGDERLDWLMKNLLTNTFSSRSGENYPEANLHTILPRSQGRLLADSILVDSTGGLMARRGWRPMRYG
ncbi:unnamed protein product [Protopolystoma xenopodis]|uniref:Uncharacterized protein n=1 Tax=Protopolystoma xenopodis TaxID=117903 RepID=A0A448WIN9_9PLAT|nr:unnamed protein product [Protopolystoma xenopodis]